MENAKKRPQREAPGSQSSVFTTKSHKVARREYRKNILFPVPLCALFALVVFIPLIFTSCHDPFSFNGSPATLTITIGGSGARSSFPSDFDPEGLLHTIQLFDANGELLYEELDVIYGQTITFSVIPGYYDFLVIARDSDEEKQAVGVASKTIRSGRNEAVDITMQPSGDGSDEFPFLVYNADGLSSIGKYTDDADFAGWGLDAEYRQIANIDLARLEGNWEPIGSRLLPFIGVYDGGGFVIENLTIRDETEDEQGLFGRVGDSSQVAHSEIRNIGLVNVDINVPNASYVGGIAGYLNGTDDGYFTIIGCYVTGNISGKNYVGGIVGFLFGGIYYSYVTGNVSGNEDIGGIVGIISSGTVHDCYVTGNVSGTDNVGGIAGKVGSGSEILQCVALNGSVTATDSANVGRVVGSRQIDTIFYGNHARSDLIPKPLLLDDLDGTDITAQQWYSAFLWIETAGFNQDIWDIADGRLPILRGFHSPQNPRVMPISTVADSFRIIRSDGESFSNLIPFGTTLTVEYTGTAIVTYEWVFLDGDTLEGDERTFTPETAGDYKLIISVPGLSHIEVEFSVEVLTLQGTIAITTQSGDTISDPVLSGTVLTASYDGSESGVLFQWNFNGEVVRSPSAVQTYTVLIPDGDYTVTVSLTGYVNKTSAPVTVSPGSGTAEDPFIVHDVATLQRAGTQQAGDGNWTLSSHYRQVRDIDLTGVEWVPIGSNVGSNQFSGVYDGCGYYISDLTITSGGTHQGLFGFVMRSGIYGIVKNVSLINIDIQGTANVGGIAGQNTNGTIENCYVQGSISGTGDSVGGIVGFSTGANAIVRNCLFAGEDSSIVSGNKDVGGIVGNNSSGTVQNCVVLCEYVVVTSGAMFNQVDEVGRIVGSGSGSLVYNFARSGLIPKYAWDDFSGYNKDPVGNAGDHIDGADVRRGTEIDQYNNQMWWTSTLAVGENGWNFQTIWEWDTSTNLPKLRQGGNQ